VLKIILSKEVLFSFLFLMTRVMHVNN
jgi:hypothetical protein